MTELQTIRDFLRFAVSQFRKHKIMHGHGTTSVIDEAVFIILETLHLPVDDINPWLDSHLLANERKALLDVIEARLATRKPAAYLLNKTYMHGIPFYVDERVIIPRSYIGEHLMKGDLRSLIEDPANVKTIIDLCTGSGCLAVLAGLVFPEATIDATDSSADALAVAIKNITDHDMQSRITLYEGDLFAAIGTNQYDLIITNPPYVGQAEVDAFPPEYKAEPQLAHLGGADGLDLVRRILRNAPNHLNKGGTLICEIGTGRHMIDEEYPELDLIWLDSENSEGEVLLLKV